MFQPSMFNQGDDPLGGWPARGLSQYVTVLGYDAFTSSYKAVRITRLCWYMSTVREYTYLLVNVYFLMYIHTFVLQRPSQFFVYLCAWLPLYDNCGGTTLTFR